MRKAFSLIYKLPDSVRKECNSYSEEFKNAINGEGTGGETEAHEQVAISVDYNQNAQNDKIRQMVSPIGG